MPNYHKLYTPQDSAIVLIDMQPQMLFGVGNLCYWGAASLHDEVI
jgi:nicotinamidase-related amidase